jgi:hypothetical protein
VLGGWSGWAWFGDRRRGSRGRDFTNLVVSLELGCCASSAEGRTERGSQLEAKHVHESTSFS